jgi:hypothetical protein
MCTYPCIVGILKRATTDQPQYNVRSVPRTLLLRVSVFFVTRKTSGELKTSFE